MKFLYWHIEKNFSTVRLRTRISSDSAVRLACTENGEEAGDKLLPLNKQWALLGVFKGMACQGSKPHSFMRRESAPTCFDQTNNNAFYRPINYLPFAAFNKALSNWSVVSGSESIELWGSGEDICGNSTLAHTDVSTELNELWLIGPDSSTHYGLESPGAVCRGSIISYTTGKRELFVFVY